MKENFMKAYGKYIFFVVVIVITLLWLSGFFTPKIKSGEIKPQAKKVSGLKVAEVEVVEALQTPYFGLVQPDDRAEIASRVFGRVERVFVKEGDAVSTGKVLAIIDAEDIKANISAVEAQIKGAEAALRAAKAQYEAERRTFERYEKLLHEKAITPQEYDEVKARYESAKERVKEAEQALKALSYQKSSLSSQLNYTTLRAPFSGTIVEKRVDVGDLATPGQALFVLERGPFKVEVEVPEKFWDYLTLNREVDVQLDEEGKEIIKGRVVERSSAINPVTRTFRVKVLLSKQTGLKSGQAVRILLPEKGKFVLIPQKSLYQRNDFTGVFVVRPDGTLELRFVKLGIQRGDKVEVISGLNPHEKIVVEGIEKACDGCILEK